MYHCDICNREVKKKIRLGGYTLCSKHMHQLHKYGKFLDNIPRTNNDLNDYKIDYRHKTVMFNMYNQKNVYTASFIADLEDIEKLKYHQWRLGTFGYALTGLPSKGTSRNASHVVLGIDSRKTNLVVDHINGNTLDNRKCNLRVITQQQNLLNRRQSNSFNAPAKGVYRDKTRNGWCSEIRFNGVRVHFTRQKNLNAAAFQRYIAEKILFKEFSRSEEIDKLKQLSKSLSNQEKLKISLYVIHKLHKYNLC